MTRADNIETVLEALGQAWHKYPELRLTQLLVNAINPQEPVQDLFYAVDDKVLAGLRTLANMPQAAASTRFVTADESLALASPAVQVEVHAHVARFIRQQDGDKALEDYLSGKVPADLQRQVREGIAAGQSNPLDRMQDQIDALAERVAHLEGKND